MSSPVHDLILRGARVIDPFTSHDGVADVAVKDGVVSAVEPGLDPDGGGDVIDLHGRWLLPGMIDTHVHVAGELEGVTGPGVGLRNVVEAGATTVIDLGGSMDRLVDGVQRYGAGANVGGLGMLKPGVTLSSDEPPFSELASVLDRALEAGQLGLKMWGGYYPFSPDVTAEVIRLCNERTAYVAFHVGTKETGSRLDGLREVPGLLGADGRLHIAHVNAYCRGSVASPAEEIAEALEIIDSLRGRVVSEVHLARPNFTRGECDGLGNVSMDVARNCLGLRGYPPTREGMRSAIRAGYGSVVRQKPSGLELVTGEDGVRLFEEADTVVGMSFPVNRSDTAFQLTAAKRQDGTFIIDAIASDAGVLPRNVNIEQAMAMTAFGALTPLEVARKISYNPARMLGLEKKGRIAPGADADFTVIDPAKGRAVMSFVGGEVIMIEGRAVGHGGTLLVTEAGRAAATACGLPFEVIDLSRSLLYSDA
ncbi:MAG: amidohydrolase family protein [Chloroflexi bacterium]|nr:amidohydrolase family protein [Chloroflexota bacterium]